MFTQVSPQFKALEDNHALNTTLNARRAKEKETECAESTDPFNQHLIKRDGSLIREVPEGPSFLLMWTLSLNLFITE